MLAVHPVTRPALVAPADRHHLFVALLPVIEARARAAFRALRCPHDRDDAVAEVVARAWERFAAGRLPSGVPADLAEAAVADIRAGLSRTA